ncbi:MAG TPA: CDGSH iron-sulfur domain-containing protein [Thermoanaerobaculia bacterium]|jgi:CDGSH-type Zn-finger protein
MEERVHHYQEAAPGGPIEEPAAENAVTLTADGPLELRGRIEIASPDGTLLLVATRASLCRCGASRDKPFCDGSHAAAGFHDCGVRPGNGGEAAPGEGPALHVVCCQDGPLVFQGAFELHEADGRPLPVRRRVLCRCGESTEKPFCDGSHARIGFKT